MVTPVDLLPASAATLQTLAERASAEVNVVTPRYRARGGHPVLLRASVL